MDGRGDARPRQGRDGAHRLALPEPACGSGNFLVPVLRRKLAAVELKFGKSDFEKRHYALFGLMCVYGIELLDDNVAECREEHARNLRRLPRPRREGDQYRAAAYVLRRTSSTATPSRCSPATGEPITFAEWGYLGKGKFQRRDFRFDTLTQMSSFGEEDTLFADLGKHEIFTPIKSYPPHDREGSGADELRRPASRCGAATPTC